MRLPKTLTGLVLLAVLTLGGGVWVKYGPVPVQVEMARTGKAVEAVYATGTVEPLDISRVGAVSAGRVVEVPVDIGDSVKSGQVLARMDDVMARQKLDDAQARLKLAQEEMARVTALQTRGFATAQALQRARAELDQAQANLEYNAKALDDLLITAPFDGYVMERNVDPGQSVGANAALFTVASTQRLRLVADVDERDIPRVHTGAEMTARAEAFPDQVFTSTVSTIKLLGDTRTRTYRVEAPLPEDTRLMAGMTVDVNIILARRDEAVLAPVQAISRDVPQGGQQGKAYVWKVEDGKARKVPVELGATGPLEVEVRSGLAAGERVIINPPGRLTEGRGVVVRS